MLGVSGAVELGMNSHSSSCTCCHSPGMLPEGAMLGCQHQLSPCLLPWAATTLSTQQALAGAATAMLHWCFYSQRLSGQSVQLATPNNQHVYQQQAHVT